MVEATGLSPEQDGFDFRREYQKEKEMKNKEKRENGKYIKENEIAIEETVVGNDYEILSFSREYFNPEEYMPKPGVYINKYTTKNKKEEVTIIETTTINEYNKVINFEKEII